MRVHRGPAERPLSVHKASSERPLSVDRRRKSKNQLKTYQKVEPRSSKITLRSSRGMIFVDEGCPRAAKERPKSVPRAPKSAPRASNRFLIKIYIYLTRFWTSKTTIFESFWGMFFDAVTQSPISPKQGYSSGGCTPVLPFLLDRQNRGTDPPGGKTGVQIHPLLEKQGYRSTWKSGTVHGSVPLFCENLS